MKVLLSTIGSRGEVQPALALAVVLRLGGHDAVVCAPPDFGELARALDVPYEPVGPSLRGSAKQSRSAVPTPEQRRQMIARTVTAQFEAVSRAADGCDVIVAGGALAVAAHSVAERQGIGYVYAAFAPVTLPSSRHAPPVLRMLGQKPGLAGEDHEDQWAQDAQHWNDLWGPALNASREALGLRPVTDVRGHIFTSGPWLAADHVLAPWPGAPNTDVVQTGAWTIPDSRQLPAEIEAFLDAGPPPVYIGFGSARAPEGITAAVIQAARRLGHRTIVAGGWADLTLVDDKPDCILAGEINHQALFPRLAAVVHHGGAGTTTTAAAAGVPQIVVPQVYDQFYFARRVEDLGIGTALLPQEPTAESLGRTLQYVLRPETASTTRAVAVRMHTDGAASAAQQLADLAKQLSD